MGISNMQGTPWHIGALKTNDERRHKDRCVYYQLSNKNCIYYCNNCTGSSFCEKYQPLSESEYEERKKAYKEIKEKLNVEYHLAADDYRGMEGIVEYPSNTKQIAIDFLCKVASSGFKVLPSINSLYGEEKYVVIRMHEIMFRMYKSANKFDKHYNNTKSEMKMRYRIEELFRLFGEEPSLLDNYNVYVASKANYVDMHTKYIEKSNTFLEERCFQLEILKIVWRKIEK